MRSSFLRLIAWGLLLIGIVPPVQAQERSLIDKYRAARFQQRVERLLERGWRLPVRSPDRVPSELADSLRALLYRVKGEEPPAPTPAFVLTDYHTIRRPERTWFQHHFADTEWAFLGRVGLTPFDTTYTRSLRARLEAHFGPPTRTLADSEHLLEAPPDEYVQFEYWFVVNDTIPVRLMDPNGPFGRGLVLMADARYRDRLAALRRALLAPLLQSEKHAPYVDYYFNLETRTWYRTGFDGDEFFLKLIPRSGIVPGRRPRLPNSAQNMQPL